MSKRIHMIGVGGIGMSALAQLYLAQGAVVTGSDREESPVTHMLKKKGVDVFVGQKAENVPDNTELVVYSDAVPVENIERVRAAELQIRQISYFQGLAEASKGKRVVAISGTNGKTTTTAMLGKILVDNGIDPTVVVGSIVSEWGSNYRQGNSDIFVVEACEYRDHFLVFNPEVLVITNIEWDHTDYFRTFEDLKHAFDTAKSQAKVVIDAGHYKEESVPELKVPGEFNKDNARAAKAAAKAVAPTLTDEQIDVSLAAFAGTWRRFEYKGTLPGGTELYDDYGHHPSAIEKTIIAAREKFPGKKIVLFFHPHLYSRTRDLFDDFAKSLAVADQVYILPIYAAREPHDPTVTHELLAGAVNMLGGHAEGIKDLAKTTDLLKLLDKDTVVFTMGAGDIYKAGESALK